jgi:hypothetical protein
MKRVSRFLWILFVALLVSGPALAQTVTGSIRGTITDPSGAIVPNAKITATNVATGVATNTTSNQAGEYSIRFLQIGQYKVTVAASGFQGSSYGPFSLEIDQTARIDVPLTIGAASDTVSVTDQIQPLLNTENATLGLTITENTINSIPLNGRDFSQLAVYTPGAVAPGFSSYGNSNSTERSTGADNEVSVNGNRQQSNNYILDGQEINENINNTVGYNPSPDALQQVRVITSNANAEFGNVNGGTVIAVMKSGTNKWHGSAFAFLKNYNLNANSWGNDRTGTPIRPYTSTQFGGTFGGPIFKDRLFFFVDYMAARSHTGGLQTTTVAPTAFRGIGTGIGNLSSLLSAADSHGNPTPIQLYDTQAVGGPAPYVNNQVPITSHVAQFLFAHPEVYPLPNRTGIDSLGISNNYIGPQRSFNKNDQGDVKIDWNFHTHDVFSFRYSQGQAGDGQTALIPVQFPTASEFPDHLFNANWIHTFSPEIVNSFAANYGRIRFNSGSTTDPSGVFGFNGNNLVGIPSGTQPAQGFSVQNFGGDGDYQLSSVGANPTPEIFIDNIFGYSDNLTWQKGKHLLKFGAQFIRYQQNSFYPGNNGELGSFNYNGTYSSLPGATTYNFADFLTDRVNDASVGAVTGRTGQRQWRDAFFAQDDWKLRPNLTVNLGLRWEYSRPIYEVNNKQANIDIATKTVIYAGQNGASRALYDPVYNQWQPRVGFAYSPMSRTVIRGGYGISSYLEGTGANLRLTQNPPFHTDFEARGISPSGSGASYNPGIVLHAANGFPTTTVPTTTFYVWPKDLKPAVVQEFSLTTEYQINNTSSFQLGYVGVLGHHLTNPFYGNQRTTPAAAGPFDNVVGTGGTVKITQTEAASNYNGLQAVYRLRPTGGLELTANYTYSKTMSDNIGFYGVSNNDSNQYYNQDSYNPKAEWSPAGTDTKHNLSVTGVYQLPFGRGKRFGGNSNFVVDEILGGWKLSGTEVYYTGFPVTINSPSHYSDQVYAFGGSARPIQYKAFHPRHRGLDAYYGTVGNIQNQNADIVVCTLGETQVLPDPVSGNPTSYTCTNPTFGQQPADRFGNVRPGSLRAPSFHNIDMAIAKSFKIWEEHRLDFRADAFNAFNIASYRQPDSNIGDATFGQITDAVSNSRNIQLSLKYSF